MSRLSAVVTRSRLVVGAGAAVLMVAAAIVTSRSMEEAASVEERTIEIRKFEYEPAATRVSEGEKVVWVNHDLVPHTATAGDGAWDSGPIEPGESWRWTADQTGVVPYTCTLHPSMKGRVDVR